MYIYIYVCKFMYVYNNNNNNNNNSSACFSSSSLQTSSFFLPFFSLLYKNPHHTQINFKFQISNFFFKLKYKNQIKILKIKSLISMLHILQYTRQYIVCIKSNVTRNFICYWNDLEKQPKKYLYKKY